MPTASNALDDIVARHLVFHLVEAGRIADAERVATSSRIWVDAVMGRLRDRKIIDDGIRSIIASLRPEGPDFTLRLAKLCAVLCGVNSISSVEDMSDVAVYAILGKRQALLSLIGRQSTPVLRVKAMQKAIVFGGALPGLNLDTVAAEIERINLPLDRLEALLEASEISFAVHASPKEFLLDAIAILDTGGNFTSSELLTNRARIAIGITGHEYQAPSFIGRLWRRSLADDYRKRLFDQILQSGDAARALDQISQMTSVRTKIDAVRNLVGSRFTAKHVRREALKIGGHHTREAVDPFAELYAVAGLWGIESLPDFIDENAQEHFSRAEEQISKLVEHTGSMGIGRSHGCDSVNASLGIENLCAIAQRFHHSGAEAQAKKAFELAVRSCEQLGDNETAESLDSPVVYFEEFFRGERMSSIAYYGFKDEALARLATTASAIGDDELALSLLDKITGKRWAVDCLVDVVFKNAPSGSERDWARFENKLKELPSFGVWEKDDAQPVFHHMTGVNQSFYGSPDSTTHAKIAELRLQKMVNARALDLAASFVEKFAPEEHGVEAFSRESGSLKARFWKKVAIGYAEGKDEMEALKILERANEVLMDSKDEQEHPFFVSNLVRQLIEWERVDLASRVCDYLSARAKSSTWATGSLFFDARKMLAEAFSKNSQKDRADGIMAGLVQEAMKKEELATKVGVLCIVAKSWGRQNNLVEADRILAAAEQLTHNVDDPALRCDSLRLVAEAVYHVCDSPKVDQLFNEAILSARRIVPRSNSIIAFSFLLKSFHVARRQELVKKGVGSVLNELFKSYPDRHCGMLKLLVPSLIAIEDWDTAISTVAIMTRDLRYEMIYRPLLLSLTIRLAQESLLEESGRLMLLMTEPADYLQAMAVLIAEKAKRDGIGSIGESAEFAFSIFKSLQPQERSVAAEFAVCHLLCSIGRNEEALKVARGISDNDASMQAHFEIGRKLLEKGEKQSGMVLVALAPPDKFIRHLLDTNEVKTVVDFFGLVDVLSMYSRDWNLLLGGIGYR